MQYTPHVDMQATCYDWTSKHSRPTLPRTTRRARLVGVPVRRVIILISEPAHLPTQVPTRLVRIRVRRVIILISEPAHLPTRVPTRLVRICV